MRGCVIFFVIFLTKIWCSQVIYAKEGQNCHDMQFYLNMCTVVWPHNIRNRVRRTKKRTHKKKDICCFPDRNRHHRNFRQRRSFDSLWNRI